MEIGTCRSWVEVQASLPPTKLCSHLDFQTEKANEGESSELFGDI